MTWARFYRSSAVAVGAFAVVSSLVACGGSGQKRQTKSAAEVVESAIENRSTRSFMGSQPQLAMAGVLEMPEAEVVPQALQVGSVRAFVHERPSASSRVVGQLSRGDAVRKTGEALYIVPPISSKMDDLDGKKNPDLLATWSLVECAGGVKGWVPTRALVLPEFFATSSEERLRELKMNRAGDSGKGMLEKRKAKLFIGKGFGSEQELSTPNMEKAKQIVASASMNPARFDLLKSDYFLPVPTSAAPAVGRTLEQVDPAAAARAAEVRAETAGFENGKPSSGLGDVMSLGMGLAGIQDEKAIVAAKIAEAIAILQKPRAPTPVEETGLGELAVAHVIGEAKVLPPSSPISAYVSNVGLRVASNCSNPYPATGYTFAVVDYAEPNAVATPGGVILVSTGMLRFLRSEDELACILGHEIAHVEERQAMLSEDVDDFAVLSDLTLMGPDLITELVGDILKDSDLSPQLVDLVKEGVSSTVADMLKEMIQDIGTSLWQHAANPGQSDECAADIRGVELAAAAGYDSSAMTVILERINAIVGSYGGANYSETRPADVAAVRAVLPVSQAMVDSARTDRWTRLQREMASVR